MRLIETVHLMFFLLALVSISGPAYVFAADEKIRDGISIGEKGSGSSPSSFSIAAPGFFNRLAAPERKAAAISLASSYDPNFNNSSLCGSIAAVYDHGQLWDGIRSDNAAFKLEGVAGALLRPELRTVVSVNMFSLFYPRFMQSREFRPYLEAGIGVIYTDYRVEDQGYRHNFNPQLGIGTEIRGKDGDTIYLALRLHHVSNGGLSSHNQGVNSLLFQVGRLF